MTLIKLRYSLLKTNPEAGPLSMGEILMMLKSLHFGFMVPTWFDIYSLAIKCGN